MLNFFKLLTFITLLVIAKPMFGQQSKPTLPGSTKGIIRDTTHNYALKSATVSIYKAADSSLISYQISNNYGEFSFKNLPVGTSLQLEVSHVSYQTLRKKFSIPTDKNFIDLQTLIINPKDISLQEVTVTIPPIRMNGDTLEFNAAAFKLDSNAVVEDLLRKIPNITLWGDGQITVNGREVKSVLVNGKSFFGGDAKVATQNIAKNALDKIQVYNTVKDKNNPLDSTLTMNLKLKKGKDVGYFGKIGIGYGTGKRYEADVSFNVFSPKMQLAIVGAGNNINKSLNSIRQLTLNSTFKGVGTNVEYQPDFRADGINQPTATGVAFTYNFVEKPTWENKNTLNANYFLQNKDTDYLTDALTTTSVSENEKVFEKWSNKTTSSSINQKFDSDYEWIRKNNSLKINQALTTNNGNSDNEIFRNATNNQGVVTSTNNTISSNDYQNSNFNFQANYRHSQNYMKPKQLIKGFNANYNLAISNSENNGLNITDFKSFISTVPNQNFNRKYQTKNNKIDQQLNLEFLDLRSMLFGKNKLWNIELALNNEINFSNTKDNNHVQDLNTGTNNYEVNQYLSNKINTNYIDDAMGFSVSKSFYKSLSNRFYKNLSIRITPKQRFVYQDNQSDRSIQNIKRNYSQFVPEANVSYSDNQYGEYYRNYSISFNTNMRIPTINQLAPLVDSTNLYSVQRGNVNLKPGVERTIAFNFNHYDQTNKNTLNYNLNIRAGMIENNIIDSTFIDNLNRRSIFLTNADGNKYIYLGGNIRKAYRFKTSEIQFELASYVNLTKNPEYINTAFTYSSNLNTNSSLGLTYTYKAYLALDFKQTYGTYRSKQEAFNTKYSGKNLATTFSSSYNITKKLTLNSNITFNKSTSQNAADINFAIWNASAIYRFLKGNNAEFKMSALDLLHQNTNILNYGSSNSFTLGTQNVLQQYFMTTLSYYPRQFGKKSQVKK
ncbi:TonB-dependent receptor [Pedobacter sp. BMA]|uniref:TonB-dependent receptor n=1 Tax=Pedobacter sp. BMA TaxID=1663685 RepID=UPI0006497B8F|nr:TonB-dependent receptor [Pedobacter sp. BMA]KLT66226.1 hypothetical protein AB669_08740 [Pedobacter sp. BMA]